MQDVLVIVHRICVTYSELGSSSYGCHDDPCAGQALSCDCAYQPICAAHGLGICNVSATGTLSCLNGG